MSTWLKDGLHKVQQHSNKTAAIIVDKSEIENLEFLGHLAKSKEFKQDLAMSKSYWYYNP
mgnify:CR=1 FL=1